MDLEHHGQVIIRDPEPTHIADCDPTDTAGIAAVGCSCDRSARFVPRAPGIPALPGAKPLDATRGAQEHFTDAVLRDAVLGLAAEAERLGHGLCFQQVYREPETGLVLWIVEDAEHIVALLPEEY
jgi:hypothetical protein